MNVQSRSEFRSTPSHRARLTGKVALAASAVLALTSLGMAGAQASDSPGTPITLTPSLDSHNAMITGDNQGFSVESADFAHGYLTKDLMAKRLTTLGHQGVIRVGGYSMDLVWPALGAFANTPPPPEAIGGVVDQADFDHLKTLLHATGWKASIGLPLKSILDPSKLKNAAKDPSPHLTIGQVVAEVKAAHNTLGNDLTSVEIGNEFDNVTTLSGGEMWDTIKLYKAAIEEAVPGTTIKLIGPSANTAATNTKLQEFTTSALADTTTTPTAVLSELSSHLYPGSHCGTSNYTIASLMSAKTFMSDRTKLDGIMDIGAQFEGKLPMTINESNSASCSGQPAVSNSYATSLWALDYQMQVAQSGISRVQFHTNTAAVCGDFKARTSPEYPISYRYYGAFCAADQAALDANELSASPLYYGIWAFRQVPKGTFVDLDLQDADLPNIRAYGVQGKHGELTLVLINVQDPAAATSTTVDVTVNLPGSLRSGDAVTLKSGDAAGLASLDAGAITLGGRQVAPSGNATGHFSSSSVAVQHGASTVFVAPGTAQIVTFGSHH